MERKRGEQRTCDAGDGIWGRLGDGGGMPTAGLVWEEPGGAGRARASSRHLRLAKLTCYLRSLNQLVPSGLLGGSFVGERCSPRSCCGGPPCGLRARRLRFVRRITRNVLTRFCKVCPKAEASVYTDDYAVAVWSA